MSEGLKPFWRYYGGKWRAAPRYPKPEFSRIVEPFAGAAGYSMRYPSRQVILVEKHPIIAEIWRWLIAARESEICENEGADWLPFAPFATLKAGLNGKGSKEVLWQGGLR